MPAKVIGFDETAKKRVTCSDCTAVVEYANVDVISRTSTDYTGGTDINRVLVCPNCSHEIYVR